MATGKWADPVNPRIRVIGLIYKSNFFPSNRALRCLIQLFVSPTPAPDHARKEPPNKF